MTLRARLLALFLLLAVGPLLAVGAAEYARSLRALEAMIASQNARVAERVARSISGRAALLRSDLHLLAENAETQRWLGRMAAGTADAAAEREAEIFLREAWSRIGSGYGRLSLLDARARVVYRAGNVTEVEPDREFAESQGVREIASLVVRDLRHGQALGAVELRPALGTLIPLDLITTGFGETGEGMVIDRASGRILHHADRTRDGAEIAPLIAAGEWEVDAGALGRPSGTFRHRSGDTLRIASFVGLQSPPWTVVVSGAVDEFAAPFRSVRARSLLTVLVVAVLATLAFSQLLRRTTRSLEKLTAATAVVGEGNLTPSLPPAGRDEVGRLTVSFETMVTRIREMVSQIEASRQMTVLGQFAAQLSHEIRNPLTSIKLNLQKLDREAREGTLPDSTVRPLGISLREVARLDGVVRGVLDLARARRRDEAPHSLSRMAEEALEVVAAQAEGQRVTIERAWDPAPDTIRADALQVRGALLNLLLNALDAMPAGGTLRITTRAAHGRISLTIADTGGGIPTEVRAEIFRPFFSTKPRGTGLGLPLARRAIEDNGGTLALAPASEGSGAEFAIEFPQAPAP